MKAIDNNYKYDIAFSLCKQDVDFARKIIAQLNPSLKVFFYENNQEELISKSGPEVFGRVFRDEARIVVILSRNEWSESYYTDIERNAIIDRTSVKNQGYNFLLVIPMMPSETPSWYPSTRIYADPQRFSIEKLAEFIEFKITDEGGKVKQLTLEERYINLQRKLAAKKQLVQMQTSSEALAAVQYEINSIHQIVLDKIKLFENNKIWSTTHQIWPMPLPGAYFRIGEILLELKVSSPDEAYQKIVSCQDYLMKVALYKSTGKFAELWQEVRNIKPFKEIGYRYLYGEEQKGWAIPFIYGKGISIQDTLVLFHFNDPNRIQNQDRYFDLKAPISTPDLIDQLFQELLTNASATIEQYI